MRGEHRSPAGTTAHHPVCFHIPRPQKRRRDEPGKLFCRSKVPVGCVAMGRGGPVRPPNPKALFNFVKALPSAGLEASELISRSRRNP